MCRMLKTCADETTGAVAVCEALPRELKYEELSILRDGQCNSDVLRRKERGMQVLLETPKRVRR